MKLNRKELFTYTAIIAVSVLLDQITKLLAVLYLKPIPTKALIEGVLHLTYHENRGAAFGILADHRWIFLSVSTIMIVALSIYLFKGKCENRLYGVSISMIIGGGIGNMIDRLGISVSMMIDGGVENILYTLGDGYVVDFIDFRLINFAIFNGADSFVCVGSALLILALVLDIIKEGRAKK